MGIDCRGLRVYEAMRQREGGLWRISEERGFGDGEVLEGKSVLAREFYKGGTGCQVKGIARIGAIWFGSASV